MKAMNGYSQEAFDPTSFFDEILILNQTFVRSNQQDSEEFLNKLLHKLEEQLVASGISAGANEQSSIVKETFCGQILGSV